MTEKSPVYYKASIAASGKTIYSPIEMGDPEHWIPTSELEHLLNDGLRGLSLSGLALRTRSKVVKEAVCESLGYPTPGAFRKVQPRFPGQQLDTYVQKSLNLQVWNEELSPSRRYAIIQVSEDDVIQRVRVVNGQELAFLDKTGTLTSKYQARLDVGDAELELVSRNDTAEMIPHLKAGLSFSKTQSPISEPEPGLLLPIQEIFERLSPLIGESFPDPGIDQERNRGASLHSLVCKSLGYEIYEDKGQFPDIRHQLLEVKLQTSPTIDLGLVLPNSDEFLDVQQVANYQPRHCDARYAVFYASRGNGEISLTHLFVATGLEFFRDLEDLKGKF